jgi:hypothetical protein
MRGLERCKAGPCAGGSGWEVLRFPGPPAIAHPRGLSGTVDGAGSLAAAVRDEAGQGKEWNLALPTSNDSPPIALWCTPSGGRVASLRLPDGW